MAVLLMILLFAVFIGFDFVRTRYVTVQGAGMSQRGAEGYALRVGTQYTTPGYEMFGAFAQDGGDLKDGWEGIFLGENI